jgi:hypothetical protein
MGSSKEASSKAAGQVLSRGPHIGQGYVVDVPAGRGSASVDWRWLLENPQVTKAW